MRRHWLIPLFVLAALLAGAVSQSPAASAEDVVARALDASTMTATVRVGDYTWVESAGIGIQLPPAPPTDSYPKMLAGKAYDGTRSAALYELGVEGFAGIKRELEADGARFSGSETQPFRPRRYPNEIGAQRTDVTFNDPRRGVMLDWVAAGRHFAVVVIDSGQDAAGRKLDDLTRELVQLGGVEADGVAPLLFQGRYTCVLNGWKNDGERLLRHAPQGWMALRVFQVAAMDFDSVGRLQFEMENKLKDAGFDRSAGMKPTIMNTEGFVGEYFGKDGFVQRIAYAKLDGGYMVALMQAPEALRNSLIEEMDTFVRTFQSSGLNAFAGPVPLYFNLVSKLRPHVWQDGRRVFWGVLFDDSRQQPVLWRQDGVKWEVRMSRGSETIFERAGEVNSSRALNPLVDAETRALVVPEGFQEEVEITINVGGLTAKSRLTLK